MFVAAATTEMFQFRPRATLVNTTDEAEPIDWAEHDLLVRARDSAFAQAIVGVEQVMLQRSRSIMSSSHKHDAEESPPEEAPRSAGGQVKGPQKLRASSTVRVESVSAAAVRTLHRRQPHAGKRVEAQLNIYRESPVSRWGSNPAPAPSASLRALRPLPSPLRSLLASSPPPVSEQAGRAGAPGSAPDRRAHVAALAGTPL